MTANDALEQLYQVAKDEDLPALDALMFAAGFRDEDGEMLDADQMDKPESIYV
jgi:hypothetical protein